MKNRKDEWKNYIKMAKNRVNGNTVTYQKEKIYLNAKPMTGTEIRKWNEIIAEVVASNEFVYNPIGQMIDREKYENMSNEKRDQYIMELSKIYLQLRNQIKNK